MTHELYRTSKRPSPSFKLVNKNNKYNISKISINLVQKRKASIPLKFIFGTH